MMFRSKVLGGIQGVAHGFGTAGKTVREYLPEIGDLIICSTEQVHGNTVHILHNPEVVLQGDAFLTSQPNIVCFVRTADCVPIIVVDPAKKAIGAIHAGWRGTEQNVTGEAIKRMQEAFGSDPADVCAAIGPAICGKCYDVDLITANYDLLLKAGVEENNIDTLNMCTRCGDYNLASYRRDRTTIRQVSFIVIYS